MSRYSPEFYESHKEGSVQSARHILPLVLQFVPARSVVDVGCGIGTWLSVVQELGIGDILGVDGGYIDPRFLMIPKDKFVQADLQQPLALGRTFDLAMCLEVAEHLPASRAVTLVASLTSLAPVVLFSAAIPSQGGTDHVNEQWPPYWKALFDERGFDFVDCVRKKVWDEEGVAFWYAQNSFLAVNRECAADYPALARLREGSTGQLSIVHPRLFAAATESRTVPVAAKLRGVIASTGKQLRRACRFIF